MDSELLDYFRPANGLLYPTMETKGRVAIGAHNEPEDGWASDGVATLFEEDHNSQGDISGDIGRIASETDELRALTVLDTSLIRMLALRVESVVLRCIQHQFQIEDQLFLIIMVRGPVIIFLGHLMFTTLKEILLGLKALLVLLGCICLICNSF
ncbi:unnamed protein product [Periconia digitata]|uniref:Uncharacterized protein n=1 Tax=Periconia digitata TaxID=1303443 RepID=A0A9W4UL40_9PLEO|nr:unnamed protein product [Periconia digitata]